MGCVSSVQVEVANTSRKWYRPNLQAHTIRSHSDDKSSYSLGRVVIRAAATATAVAATAVRYVLTSILTLRVVGKGSIHTRSSNKCDGDPNKR